MNEKPADRGPRVDLTKPTQKVDLSKPNKPVDLTKPTSSKPGIYLTKDQVEPTSATQLASPTTASPKAAPGKFNRKSQTLLGGLAAAFLLGVATIVLINNLDLTKKHSSDYSLSNTPDDQGSYYGDADSAVDDGYYNDDLEDSYVDEDQDAETQLAEIVSEDASTSASLEGTWTAQLASSTPGESAANFLDKYYDLKDRYPAAILIWSGDWVGSFGPSSLSSWVVLSGDSYATTRPLLEWCVAEGRSEGQCWAKRLSTTGDDPQLNTDRAPADDRNN